MMSKKKGASSYSWIKVAAVGTTAEHGGWLFYWQNLFRYTWNYGAWCVVVVVLALGYLHYVVPDNHKDWLSLLPQPNYIVFSVGLIAIIGLVICHVCSVEQKHNFHRRSVSVSLHHFFHLIRPLYQNLWAKFGSGSLPRA